MVGMSRGADVGRPIGCAVLALAACVTLAGGAAADDFYQGKSITLIVSTGVGGGYDAYARSFARHFGRHLPGAPNVIVQNMPGGGGLRATNYLYNSAPKDGTVVGLVHSSAVFA